MRKEVEKKNRGWFMKPTVTEYFVTKDEKRFLVEDEAKKWEWYLENKHKIFEKYQFSDFSPLYHGIHHIHRPIFAYKFYVENYDEKIENELIPFLYGKVYENIQKNGHQWMEIVKIPIVNTIKNKIGGWFYIVLDETHSGEYKIYVSEYINKTNVE